MADKTIGQLTPASQVTPTDLFVLEQSGTAKKLTGQILENWLVSFADGHGGIQSIAKAGTTGLTDTYTITLSDTTTMTFTVTNGKGIQSIATYWAVSSNGTTPPTSWSLTRQSMTATNRYLWSYQAITYNDGTQSATTQSVVGVYGDKGNTGNTGVGISNLTQTARTPGVSTTYTFTMTDGSTKSFISYDGVGIADIAYTSSSGLVDTYTVTMTNGDTDTFTVTNAKSITSVAMVSGTHAPGTTDTYRITFNDGDTTDFTVYNGTNGTGSVSAVDGIQAVSQNVPLLLTGNGAPTASTVGQLNQRYFDLTSHILYICTAIDSSGSTTTYSWAGTGVPVDSALSTMSENPVQNKAIANRFGTIETTLASKFPYSGGTMNGNIVMANHKITNLGDPTANGDAVNKSYVDGQLANYRTSVAQDAIDAAQDAQIETISHRNLLDNWYFVGGGSQFGNGVLPINQRGQTVYAGGNGIDRWTISSSPLQLTATESGIELRRISDQYSPYFAQYLSQKAPAGVYTVSLLYKASLAEGDSVSIVTRMADASITVGTIDSSKADWTLATFTFTATDYFDAFRIQFYNESTQVDDAIELAALKLERGSYQTLAHEENGVWVLNEIPDYGEELAKCQRYLQLIPASSDFLAPLGYGLGYGTTEFRINVPLSTPMAKTPTVTIQNCTLRFYQESLASAISAYSGVFTMGGNASTLKYRPYVVLRFTVTGSVNGKPAILVVSGQSGDDTTSGILLSAEG